MALPQYVVKDPDGKTIGVFDSRANAEEAVRRDVEARAGEYMISDEAFRAQERAEQASFRKAEEARKADLERQKVKQAAFAAERQ